MCSGITIESKNIWQSISQFLEYSVLAQMIMNEICIFIHWSSVAYSNFLFQSLNLYIMVMEDKQKYFYAFDYAKMQYSKSLMHLHALKEIAYS